MDEEDTDFHISSESIKHLIFREEPDEVSFPMYHSKFNAKIKEDYKKNRECHKTMGVPSDFYLSMQGDYLKKRNKIVRRPDVRK